MNKIILSLSTIAFVAAIAIVGTTAYFSDVEKSVGNTFTAGEFDLTIDSTCHLNGVECICRTEGQSHAGECYWDKGGDGAFGDGEIQPGNECDCTWDAKDLTDEKFFNFANLKPGDSGEATISMHVEGDNYYVRSKVDNVWNKDNGCNEPETDLGDHSCGDWGGELGENMDFAFWADMGTTWGYDCPAGQPGCAADPKEGDNILNTYSEYVTYLATLEADDPGEDWSYVKNQYGKDWEFIDGSTYYMGVAWCVGDINVGSTLIDPLNPDPDNYTYGAITCDGSGVTSIIQTDSYSSDMTFEVIQATHNDPDNPFGI